MGPHGPYDAGNWSCVRLVLTPRDTGAIADRSHHRRLWRQQPLRAPCQGAAAQQRVGGPEGKSADVSGTLVFDERADTQESDPAVDRVVLVLVGASVRHAGHADGGPGRRTTKASSSSTATRSIAPAPATTGPPCSAATTALSTLGFIVDAGRCRHDSSPAVAPRTTSTSRSGSSRAAAVQDKNDIRTPSRPRTTGRQRPSSYFGLDRYAQNGDGTGRLLVPPQQIGRQRQQPGHVQRPARSATSSSSRLHERRHHPVAACTSGESLQALVGLERRLLYGGRATTRMRDRSNTATQLALVVQPKASGERRVPARQLPRGRHQHVRPRPGRQLFLHVPRRDAVVAVRGRRRSRTSPRCLPPVHDAATSRPRSRTTRARATAWSRSTPASRSPTPSSSADRKGVGHRHSRLLRLRSDQLPAELQQRHRHRQ